MAVVATLGELAAAVAGSEGDVLLAMSPGSLHKGLRTFIGHLKNTLDHHGVTSLGQALAALEANLGATWDHVRAAARAWRDSVAALGDSWARLAREATKLRDTCRDTATAEATIAATARAGDLQEKTTRCKTERDNLKAVAKPESMSLSKVVAVLASVSLSKVGAVLEPMSLFKDGVALLATHEARVGAATDKIVVATDEMEEAVTASGQARAATKRGQRAEVALEPLERLVAACDRASALPRELQRRLRDIEAALEGTREMSPNVPKALVAAVAEAERLWEASARLARRHLLGTLGDIRILLSSQPGGPGVDAVAKRCQSAIEDIPGLLRGQ